MKYLLSTNKTTTDIREYVGDLIKLHLLIRNKEIPYWNGGSEDIVESITEEEILSSVRSVVGSIIEKISSSVKGTTVSLSGVYGNSNSIKINILIGGILETYDIKRNY